MSGGPDRQSAARRREGYEWLFGEDGVSAEAEVLRLDDQICPHCGRELQAEWDEFPPALQKKYGKPGEWYYHPCTPECEKKNERREWELMRRDARVATLRERSDSPSA